MIIPPRYRLTKRISHLNDQLEKLKSRGRLELNNLLQRQLFGTILGNDAVGYRINLKGVMISQ